MAVHQLASFRERMGSGALDKRARRVTNRKAFRSGVVEEFGTHASRLDQLEGAMVEVINRVDRDFFGRLKALIVGR